MPRIYREVQREAERKVCQELIVKLEDVYLEAFDNLTDIGFGDGVLAKLTQLLLISKDSAISPLNSELEKTSSYSKS